jgi:hypothetical protein
MTVNIDDIIYCTHEDSVSIIERQSPDQVRACHSLLIANGDTYPVRTIEGQVFLVRFTLWIIHHPSTLESISDD